MATTNLILLFLLFSFKFQFTYFCLSYSIYFLYSPLLWIQILFGFSCLFVSECLVLALVFRLTLRRMYVCMCAYVYAHACTHTNVFFSFPYVNNSVWTVYYPSLTTSLVQNHFFLSVCPVAVSCLLFLSQQGLTHLELLPLPLLPPITSGSSKWFNSPTWKPH